MHASIIPQVQELKLGVRRAQEGDSEAYEALKEKLPTVARIVRRALETGKAYCRIGSFALNEAQRVHVDSWLPEDVKREHVVRKVVHRLFERVTRKQEWTGTARQGLLDTVRM